jgi:hypothetical protein
MEQCCHQSGRVTGLFLILPKKNKQKNLQRREKYRLLHGGLLRGAGLLENIVVSRNGCFQSDL